MLYLVNVVPQGLVSPATLVSIKAAGFFQVKEAVLDSYVM